MGQNDSTQLAEDEKSSLFLTYHQLNIIGLHKFDEHYFPVCWNGYSIDFWKCGGYVSTILWIEIIQHFNAIIILNLAQLLK